jgi:tripartite-type tricarboxylate transporter receptor subunit TctC
VSLVRTGAFALALVGLTPIDHAAAQSYPTKPIRMIVPFGAGTQTDVLARLFGQKLTEAWGQQVIIENRPGAAAILGTDLAAKANPDGYTLTMNGTGAMAINPGLYRKLPYDPVRDFAPITKLVIVTQVLVANPSFAAKSVKEFIAIAKAKPGQLNYGSFGSGAVNHLTTEMLQSAAGIQLGNNVSFRGSADANIQVMSGELPVMFDSMTSVLPHVKSGKLRGLAVSTATRSPFLPELPTIAESGYPGFEVAGWTGVFAPASTPAAVLDKIDRELIAAAKRPEVRELFNTLAFAPAGGSREEFRRYIVSEIAKWTKAIKDSGTKID